MNSEERARWDAYQAEKHGRKAYYLAFVRKDPEQAENFFQQALVYAPNDARLLGNYAAFLDTVRRDPDHAEEQYVRALAADPEDSANLAGYAAFLSTVRGDHDRAEDHYRRAIAADPGNASTLAAYAAFLTSVRNDHAGAEEAFRSALAADPGNAHALGRYAAFLSKVRRDQDAAEDHYRRAIAIDPANAHNLGNNAAFRFGIRGDRNGAERLLLQAIEADPLDALNLARYASVLHLGRKNPARALVFSRRAAQIRADDPEMLADHASILLASGSVDEGRSYLDRADALSPPPAIELVIGFLRYAHEPDRDRGAHGLRVAKRLIHDGVRAEGWVLDENVEAARRAGHPEPELVAALAIVIADQQPIAGLADHEAWETA